MQNNLKKKKKAAEVKTWIRIIYLRDKKVDTQVEWGTGFCALQPKYSQFMPEEHSNLFFDGRKKSLDRFYSAGLSNGTALPSQYDYTHPSIG